MFTSKKIEVFYNLDAHFLSTAIALQTLDLELLVKNSIDTIFLL